MTLGIMLFPNFHPKTLQMKIPSKGDKILSMDKIFIHRNHPWMENSYPWIKVTSMEKVMNDLFICGCYTWMKSIDKDDG